MFGYPEKIVNMALRAMIESGSYNNNPESIVRDAFDIQEAYHNEEKKRWKLEDEAKKQANKAAQKEIDASFINYGCLAIWRQGKLLVTRRKDGGKWCLPKRPGADGDLTLETLHELNKIRDTIPGTLGIGVIKEVPEKHFTVRLQHGHGHNEVNERYVVHTGYSDGDVEPNIPEGYDSMWIAASKLDTILVGGSVQVGDFGMFLRAHWRKVVNKKAVTPKKPEEPVHIGGPVNKHEEAARLAREPKKEQNPDEIMPPMLRNYPTLAIWRHSRLFLIRYTGSTNAMSHTWILPRVQTNGGMLTPEMCEHMDGAMRRLRGDLLRHCMNLSETPNECIPARIIGEINWIYSVTSVEGEPCLDKGWEGKWFTALQLDKIMHKDLHHPDQSKRDQFHPLIQSWWGPIDNQRPKMPKKQKVAS